MKISLSLLIRNVRSKGWSVKSIASTRTHHGCELAPSTAILDRKQLVAYFGGRGGAGDALKGWHEPRRLGILRFASFMTLGSSC